MPDVLATGDRDAAKEAYKLLTKQGLDISLGAKVESVEKTKSGVAVKYTDADDEEQTLKVDKLIVAIGRVPYTEGLGADTVGLKLDERCFIVVDVDCKENMKHVLT